MKTTIDMADALLQEARQVASRDGVTLRALLEEGLRYVLARRAEKPAFQLRDVSFGGDGLQPGFSEGDWESIRAVIYEDRGA